MLELRILIVGAPEALVQALGEEYRLSYSCLRDLTEMEQALEQSWDFLLLSESPFEPFLSPALRRKLPSIVVAEPEQENEAIALVDAGASDYVIRGDWRRLRSIIRRLRRDTSSMKNMTEKVNESEYRYRTLFKNSCAVMLLIEPGSRRIVDCNSAACSFYGYSEAEMRGKDLFEINMHSPEQLSRDIEMVENQQCQRYYFPHRLASGEIRQVEVFSLPIQIEKKNYLYSIVLDITERKKIEENLRLAEARNRGILNALPDRLLFLDSEGVCIDYRATKSDSLAFPAEAFLGKRVTEVVPPEVAELISATLEAVRTLGEVQTVEYYISTVHGERRYFETRIAPTPAGEFVSLARDITARRGVEEELIYSKEAAEIANRAKSEFLTNMSHEIRTPLNGIFGLTELALGTALSQEQRDYLQLIKASADSLRTVIDDVLDFSKIEAGKLSLDSIPLSLRECVATLRTFLPQALEKGLQLAWYVRAEVPDALVGDPMRLRQILVNLIGNAIKFTPEGEVIVMVELDSLDEKEAVLHFSVSDSGIGIPENKRKSIFDSFEQADTSMSRRYGGTGLGLAISTKFVEMMGGRIWVCSELEEGSTFHFTARFGVLPLDEKFPEKAEQVLSLPPLRILLAEDNPVNQILATRMLEKKEHSVTLARDGKEALELWQEGLFDLVLMDIQMPHLNGLEATAAIREREKNGGHCLIVAMTANAMMGDREICLDAGMDGYVAKPVQSERLFEEILRVIVTHRLR